MPCYSRPTAAHQRMYSNPASIMFDRPGGLLLSGSETFASLLNDFKSERALTLVVSFHE